MFCFLVKNNSSKVNKNWERPSLKRLQHDIYLRIECFSFVTSLGCKSVDRSTFFLRFALYDKKYNSYRDTFNHKYDQQVKIYQQVTLYRCDCSLLKISLSSFVFWAKTKEDWETCHTILHIRINDSTWLKMSIRQQTNDIYIKKTSGGSTHLLTVDKCMYS